LPDLIEGGGKFQSEGKRGRGNAMLREKKAFPPAE